jgi:hypothetical protein
MSRPAIRVALFAAALATFACAGQPTAPRLPTGRPSLDGSAPCDSTQTDTTASSYCRGGYVNPHV